MKSHTVITTDQRNYEATVVNAFPSAFAGDVHLSIHPVTPRKKSGRVDLTPEQARRLASGLNAAAKAAEASA